MWVDSFNQLRVLRTKTRFSKEEILLKIATLTLSWIFSLLASLINFRLASHPNCTSEMTETLEISLSIVLHYVMLHSLFFFKTWMDTLGQLLFNTFAALLKSPLVESLGSRSENWLRPKNWAKDFDFALGKLPWPSSHPSLISFPFVS